MRTHQTPMPTLDQADSERSTQPRHTSQESLYSINPVDQSIVGEVELKKATSADELVKYSREAQRAWSRQPLSQRIGQMRSVFHQILDWREELLELLVDETGKSELQARWELWKTCEEVTDMLSGASEKLETSNMSRWWTPGRRMQSSWQPRGVVLVIASGFDPLQTTVAPALAAMAAGNAVIIAADERSPLAVHSISSIAESAGLPDALWQGIAGGRRLVDSLADRVDAIVSYGPSMLTRRLARRQGDRMIPVLGRWSTRDVMIVLNDADITKAARAAVCGSCTGAGRTRRSLSRIYVQDSVADTFVDAVIEEMGTLKQGDHGGNGYLEVGPLSDRQDLQKMEELVDDAARSGARLVAGGRARPRCRGAYFEPTVLTGVDESMRLWQESAQGPIVAIARIQAPAEAVRRTRDIAGYGAVSIYSENRAVARNLGLRMSAPVVGINEVVCDLPVTSPPARTTDEGPFDPIGADRLQALSQRTVMVERPWSALPRLLETRAPARAGKALDAALSLVHRRGWVQKAVDTILPGR